MVNVWMGDTSHKESSRAEAISAAKEEARANGLPEPKLLFECGSPELRIILEGGAVVRVYYRNAEIPPIITVTDLDLGNEPEKDGGKVYASLKAGGFELLPHIVDDFSS